MHFAGCLHKEGKIKRPLQIHLRCQVIQMKKKKVIGCDLQNLNGTIRLHICGHHRVRQWWLFINGSFQHKELAAAGLASRALQKEKEKVQSRQVLRRPLLRVCHHC